MIKITEKPTTVKYYVNKRNKNKYLEVHADGYGHYNVVQFMRFASGVENKTGDRILHRWRVDNLSELLADYEECPNPRTNPRYTKDSEFIDYTIDDGEGYIRTYDDYVRDFKENEDIAYDFGNVDAYIDSLIDNGDVKVFNDISDEEYNYYFGESNGMFDGPGFDRLANWSNRYKVTFKDGTVKYTRAKNKFGAEQNVCYIDNVDCSDDIVSVEELDESIKSEGTKYKRVAKVNEFDNGRVLHKWTEMSNEEAEEKARIASIADPKSVYYVQYDDIMNPSSDLSWKAGKSYNVDDRMSLLRKTEASTPELRKKISNDIWDLFWKYCDGNPNKLNDDFFNGLKELRSTKYADNKSTFDNIKRRIVNKEIWYD